MSIGIKWDGIIPKLSEITITSKYTDNSNPNYDKIYQPKTRA